MQQPTDISFTSFRVLEGYTTWFTKHKEPPRFVDIASTLDMTSEGVRIHAKKLIDKGYLVELPGRFRNIVLPNRA